MAVQRSAKGAIAMGTQQGAICAKLERDVEGAKVPELGVTQQGAKVIGGGALKVAAGGVDAMAISQVRVAVHVAVHDAQLDALKVVTQEMKMAEVRSIAMMEAVTCGKCAQVIAAWRTKKVARQVMEADACLGMTLAVEVGAMAMVAKMIAGNAAWHLQGAMAGAMVWAAKRWRMY